MKSKGALLRQLIAKNAVVMPGVPNASMARQVEHAGFDAVYASGAGMANATAGVPDIGLLGMTEVVRLAGYIAQAVRIPVIVDADTGFGGAENVGRTIRELESAGLEWAALVCGKSPTSQRMLKFALNAVDDGLIGQQVFAGETTRLAYMTDEAVEGRDAFLEKRSPDWSKFPYYF